MKKILNLIVYSNIWVALAVASLGALTLKVVGGIFSDIIFFLFFSTLLMYAYARFFESPARIDEPKSNLTNWKENNKWVYISSGIVGAIGTLYYSFSLEKNTLIWLVVCGAISALYPLQFLQKGKTALRNVAGVKLFVISLVWAIATTVLPAMQMGLGLSSELLFLTAQRFLFVMAITIPFDIRDLRIDSPGIQTLPHKLGVKTARTIALFALLLAEVGAVVLYFSDLISAANMFGQILAFEVTSLLIRGSNPKRPDLYFSFGVESTSIFLFLSVAIFTYFWP